MAEALFHSIILWVRAAAFRRAVSGAAEARNALVAHAAYRHGSDPNAAQCYPAEVQALLDAYEAEIAAVTQRYFGPSPFTRVLEWARLNFLQRTPSPSR